VSESDRPAAPDPWASVPDGPGQVTPPGAPVPGYGPYPPPGMMPPYYYPGYQVRRTNGMAVASMVCGICGFIYLIPGLLGIIFGFVALHQINRDKTEGRGMAIAGIVTGAVWAVLFGVLIGLLIAFAGNAGQ
jgi:hypothetical protein